MAATEKLLLRAFQRLQHPSEMTRRLDDTKFQITFQRQLSNLWTEMFQLYDLMEDSDYPNSTRTHREPFVAPDETACSLINAM